MAEWHPAHTQGSAGKEGEGKSERWASSSDSNRGWKAGVWRCDLRDRIPPRIWTKGK